MPNTRVAALLAAGAITVLVSSCTDAHPEPLPSTGPSTPDAVSRTPGAAGAVGQVVGADVVRVSPRHPRAKERVRFTVEGTAPGGKHLNVSQVSFGDGAVFGGGPSCATMAPQVVTRQRFRETFDHVYKRPGRYAVHVVLEPWCRGGSAHEVNFRVAVRSATARGGVSM